MFKISLFLLFVTNVLAMYTNGGGYGYGYGQQMTGGMSCASIADCPSGASCQYGQCMMQYGMYGNNQYGMYGNNQYGESSSSYCNGQYCPGPCQNGICMSATNGGYGNTMTSYNSLPSMMYGSGSMNGFGCYNCPVGLCQNGVCMSSSYNNMNSYNGGGYNNYG